MKNELRAHIEALNAKTAEWVAQDPKNRWACGLVTDPEHWAQYGIQTPAQLDHYLLVAEVYDTHKAVWDFKPNWAHLNSLSDNDLRQELNKLKREYEHQRAQIRADRWHRKALKALRRAAARVPRTLPPAKSGFTIGELCLCL